MFGSIRWRLVTSYVFLTLLTVSLVGLLAIWGVKRFTQQQEINYLRANADTIARQAAPLIWPQPLTHELAQLAKAGSFFGNVQVRILDSHQHILADSGPPGLSDEFAWLMLSADFSRNLAGISADDLIRELLPDLPEDTTRQLYDSPFWAMNDLPPGTSLTIVRRHTGSLGGRFSFRTTTEKGTLPAELLPAVEDVIPGAPAPRSKRTVTLPIGQPDRPIGSVEISSGIDLSAETLNTTRRAFVLAGSGAVILAVILGLIMGKRLSQPLSRLTETTAQMSAGNLSVRAPVRGNDETGRLAAQFNQMAEQLQASFAQLEAERDSLRRFIADASHELRTPITALKNFNELLQGAAAQDPQARAEFLAESETQLERLEWITHNLLDLSRLDAGLALLEIENHDLREIVAAASAPFKNRAGEKRIKLTSRLPASGLTIECDRARLEIALSNLLDNALKYTPPGGQVIIEARDTGHGIRIQVKDSGAGISVDELPHIFERFYRGRNPSGEGSGLGLSIAQSIIQAHGGRITAQNAPEGGALFIIEWPE